MQIQTNISLKHYSTMRLGGAARNLVTVHGKDELAEALLWAQSHKLPILVLGEGSNVIIGDGGFGGLVVINRIRGFEVLEDTQTGTTIKVGAGEHWDDVVVKTVERGLSGIEQLSLIPGTAGATPVQNVGAYGTEIADTLTELEAYEVQTNRFIKLNNEDCHFTYRNSIFKSLEGRRHIITSITLALRKTNPQPPFYKSLQRYLDERHITTFTPQTIRLAVASIRSISLPDPALVANTGSFFKNPIVPHGILQHLQIDHPDIPWHEMPDGRAKLLAGWLIDRAGLKGYRAHGMKVYESNALVFVNESARTYHDLAVFKAEVVDRVHRLFGIVLEQEPETIA